MCGNFTVANLRIEKQDATDEEAKIIYFWILTDRKSGKLGDLSPSQPNTPIIRYDFYSV